MATATRATLQAVPPENTNAAKHAIHSPRLRKRTYMGHSSITITLDRYGHLLPGNEAEAVAKIDAYLERADTAARLVQVAR
jgi:hypothetical protein